MTDSTPRPQGSGPRDNLDFLREIVRRDIRAGVYGGRVATRFPPEPNGFLHIGHAKSVCINFGIAAEFGGVCHMRFDDTNPETEDMAYVESIRRDVRWLGFVSMESARNRRKVRQGIVVSAAGDKTCVVQVSARKRHPLYGKMMTSSKKFHTHDEKNECGVGDTVVIMETRPLSKLKRWRLVQIVEKAK